jgi:hypothetical protein
MNSDEQGTKPEDAEEPEVVGAEVLPIKRVGGRPPKVHPAGRANKINDFVAADHLLHSIDSNENPLQRLRRIQREIARESSVIQFERDEAMSQQKPGSVLAMRRIEALSRLATIELKVRELDNQSVSLSTERMQILFEFWTKKVLEAAAEVMPEEQLKLFTNKWGTSMENFVEDAEALLR